MHTTYTSKMEKISLKLYFTNQQLSSLEVPRMPAFMSAITKSFYSTPNSSFWVLRGVMIQKSGCLGPSTRFECTFSSSWCILILNLNIFLQLVLRYKLKQRQSNKKILLWKNEFPGLYIYIAESHKAVFKIDKLVMFAFLISRVSKEGCFRNKA